MRYYKLQVGQGRITGGFKLESSYKNRTPLNINFSIKAYSQSSVGIPTTIRIYGIGPAEFKELKKLLPTRTVTQGKDEKIELRNSPRNMIELWAGWEFVPQSSLSKKAKMKPKTNQLLFKGYISNIVGNFDTHDTWIQFSASFASTKEKLQLQVEPGEQPASKLRQLLKKLSDYDVDVSIAATTYTYTGSQSITKDIRTIPDLIEVAEASFGLAIYEDATNSKIKIELIGDPIGFAGGFVLLTVSDVIGQPICEGVAGRISVTCHLNPAIRLGALVTIVGTLPIAGGSWSDEGRYLPGVVNTNMVFQNGVFKVIEVHHNGNFYGTNASDWSTKATLIPVGSRQ